MDSHVEHYEKTAEVDSEEERTMKRKQSNKDEIAAFRQDRKNNIKAGKQKVEFDVKEKKKAPQLSTLLRVKRKNEDGADTNAGPSETAEEAKHPRVDSSASTCSGAVAAPSNDAVQAKPAESAGGAG